MPVKISIITICFNNLNELLSTITSVNKQTILPYEHWIIDGSSNSNIKEYLESHPQPTYRKWLCERDKGIADAFNKGIQLATGDIVNTLNSGDCFFNENVLQSVTNAFEKDNQLQWLHGKYQLLRGGILVTIGKPFEKEKLYRGMRSLAHPSMFIKKALHDKYGLYKTDLSIAMDYDIVCRISAERCTFLPETLLVFAPGGTSQVNYIESLHQTQMVYESYFGSSIKMSVWMFRLKMLHYILKSPAGKLLYKLKVWLKLENM